MKGYSIEKSMTAVLLGIIWLAPLVHAEKTLPVADGLKVTLDYTLTLADKTVADSTAGKEPFFYIHGENQISPEGLEKALTGLKAGDRKRISLTAAEAYGPYDEKKKAKVPKANVPPETKVGSVLRSQEGYAARVLEMNADTVLLDMNHPLAGKNLVFDVTILKVEKPALTK